MILPRFAFSCKINALVNPEIVCFQNPKLAHCSLHIIQVQSILSTVLQKSRFTCAKRGLQVCLVELGQNSYNVLTMAAEKRSLERGFNLGKTLLRLNIESVFPSCKVILHKESTSGFARSSSSFMISCMNR